MVLCFACVRVCVCAHSICNVLYIQMINHLLDLNTKIIDLAP